MWPHTVALLKCPVEHFLSSRTSGSVHQEVTSAPVVIGVQCSVHAGGATPLAFKKGKRKKASCCLLKCIDGKFV